MKRKRKRKKEDMEKDTSRKKGCRLTIRLRPHQMQVLEEMREKMGVSCSLIVRSIILDFLERNEDSIDRIMTSGTGRMGLLSGKASDEEMDMDEMMEGTYWEEGTEDSWN